MEDQPGRKTEQITTWEIPVDNVKVCVRVFLHTTNYPGGGRFMMFSALVPVASGEERIEAHHPNSLHAAVVSMLCEEFAGPPKKQLYIKCEQQYDRKSCYTRFNLGGHVLYSWETMEKYRLEDLSDRDKAAPTVESSSFGRPYVGCEEEGDTTYYGIIIPYSETSARGLERLRDGITAGLEDIVYSLEPDNAERFLAHVAKHGIRSVLNTSED